jgi:flagellar biosynthetic protein FlhB
MAFGESPGQERTEQPTTKRREEARRKGQVAKSADLTTAALLLGALAAGALAGKPFIADAVETFRHGLGAASNPELTPGAALALLFGTSATIARLAGPFVVIPAAAALGTQLLQTRLVASWEALTAQWSRVNPLQGLGRLLSARNLIETLKTVIKLAAIGGVAYATLRANWPLLLVLGQAGSAAALATLGQVVRDLWVGVGLTYLALAGLDYGYQWWQHRQSLQMTREEVREENKEVEGNPQLRSRIRALHRQRVMRRMMAEVRSADVVLRNPVHVAVALRYEGGRMRAPKVVAKGARLVARRIVEIAQRHSVPVIESPPLARSLFRAVAVGQEIPRELYRMVAEVLAYVYSLRGPGR